MIVAGCLLYPLHHIEILTNTWLHCQVILMKIIYIDTYSQKELSEIELVCIYDCMVLQLRMCLSCSDSLHDL